MAKTHSGSLLVGFFGSLFLESSDMGGVWLSKELTVLVGGIFGAFDDRRIWFLGSLPSCNAFVSTLVRTHLLRDI